ncbi:prepilin-type N-terminal cleavage/methylation domain-containing protein [Cellvibrio mixtus]|uniref:prepilin-type N-terminal cleavage/methylation domain-containing protein n=1 Tax=Cellvibrio mixtus TaxID=39650 RepID=UPI0005868891|nr:prepilin-type N-terminal cleavage/methylation domain-containing protein [Cellvibrio mixtus]
MKSFSTNRKPARTLGFSLLEMLVVILLVSLLASLLMQGFIYMSGTYSTVERRQMHMQQQDLFEGWIRESIHGLINGVDGALGKNQLFSGDEASFSGISLGALAGSPVGTPVKVVWILERKDGKLMLRYGEAPLSATEFKWYTIKEWPATVNASWHYLYQGEWLNGFPPRTSIFSRDKKNVLPQAISLYIDSIPLPVQMIIAVRNNPAMYTPPAFEGVL